MKKKILISILCLVLCFALGCRNHTLEEEAYKYTIEDYDSVVTEEAAADEIAFDSGASLASGVSEDIPYESVSGDTKLLYYASMSLTTSNAFDAYLKAMELCESMGGYVSSTWSSEATEDCGAFYSVTLRVPATSLQDLMEKMKDLGTVDSSSLSADDITASYYDTDARLKAAKAEEEALLKLLDDCKNVEEVLAVRSQLLTVREEIEMLQGTKDRWDNQVAYSTLDISISEPTPGLSSAGDDPISLFNLSDVWSNIKLGFANSWRFALNALYVLLIFLSNALLPMLLLGAIVFGIVKLIQKLKKKKKEKTNSEK